MKLDKEMMKFRRVSKSNRAIWRLYMIIGIGIGFISGASFMAAALYVSLPTPQKDNSIKSCNKLLESYFETHTCRYSMENGVEVIYHPDCGTKEHRPDSSYCIRRENK